MEKQYLKEGDLPVSENKSFDFGGAIGWLKAGHKVARSGWNGKGMFLYYVPANRYPAVTDIGKQIGIAGTGGTQEWDGKVPYGAYIAMKTVQNNVVPWLASQTDVLAEDWELVE